MTASIIRHYIEDLKIGQSGAYERIVSEADIANFGAVSGDMNPLHFDEEYAKTTIFKGRIAHGMLSVSFLSTVLGMDLPGPGAIFLSANLRFKAPVRIGDKVVASCTVREIDEKRGRVAFDCSCTVGGTIVVEGDVVVKVPSRAKG